jgi:hypothetical protein
VWYLYFFFPGKFSIKRCDAEPEIGDRKPSSVLMVGEEKYAVVGYVLHSL